jgi:hypothetical protein
VAVVSPAAGGWVDAAAHLPSRPPGPPTAQADETGLQSGQRPGLIGASHIRPPSVLVSFSFLPLPRPDHTRVAGDCFLWTISLLTRSCMVCVEGGGVAAAAAAAAGGARVAALQLRAVGGGVVGGRPKSTRGGFPLSTTRYSYCSATSGTHPQEEAAQPASLATQRETLGGSRW